CFSKTCAAYKKSIPREALDNDFHNLLKAYSPNRRLLPIIQKRILKKLASSGSEHSRSIKKNQNILQRLEAENRELMQMRRRLLISDEEFVNEHRALTEQILNTRTLVARDRRAAEFSEPDIQLVLDFLSRLPDEWAQIPSHLQERFEKLIFGEG